MSLPKKREAEMDESARGEGSDTPTALARRSPEAVTPEVPSTRTRQWSLFWQGKKDGDHETDTSDQRARAATTPAGPTPREETAVLPTPPAASIASKLASYPPGRLLCRARAGGV
jgi:hypothetical protein